MGEVRNNRLYGNISCFNVNSDINETPDAGVKDNTGFSNTCDKPTGKWQDDSLGKCTRPCQTGPFRSWDSDEGENYFRKGFARNDFNTGGYWDTCTTIGGKPAIEEFSVNTNGDIISRTVPCPAGSRGCVNGACIADHHAILLRRAVVNGFDITQNRKIVVSPGQLLWGSLTVMVHNPERPTALVPVAGTPNWTWDGKKHSGIYTQLATSAPVGNTLYTYVLPAGLKAPAAAGIYYIGVFSGSVYTSAELMSCDGITRYWWDDDPPGTAAGKPAGTDVAGWVKPLWEKAFGGNHVDGFAFCHEDRCGTGLYGATAIKVEVQAVGPLPGDFMGRLYR